MRPASGIPAADFARARALFEQTVELPVAEQEPWLRGACGADAALFTTVWQLVLADRDAGTATLLPVAFDRAAFAVAGPGADAKLGAFRLLRRIGSGGMGDVWEAEQEQPRRRVAVKVLRAGAARGSLLARFLSEIDILARLSHPSIAQVYASGVQAFGDGDARVELPWYALELLEGARDLATYAREERLSRAARLDLFTEVCGAVAHAHQRGVIHRDLKPANVLVTRDGRPKVIDFGVARAIDGAASAAGGPTLVTQGGEVLGTLRTMAPEQLGGGADPVDVRADVYALGVMLYELLCDAPPIDLAGLSIVDAAAAIRERAPTPPRKLVPALPRELEWIALRCLEKERERRYGSVDALAADLAAFRAGLPVEAGPPSRVYRLRKLARRHALAFALAAIAFAALAGGLGATLVALSRAHTAEKQSSDDALAARAAERLAEQRAEEARRESVQKSNLTEMIAFAADQAALDAPGRPVLLREILDRVEAAASSQHMISADVAGVIEASLVRLYAVTGDLERARECSDRALELLKQAGLEHAPQMATMWADRAILFARRGELAAALDAAERARAIDAERLSSYSSSVYVQFARARAVWEAGRAEEAIAILWEAQALARLGRDENPDQLDVVTGGLATLLVEVGRVSDAVAHAFEAARNEERRHGPLHRHSIDPRLTLGSLYAALGAPHAALAVFDEAVAACAAVEGPHDLRTLRARHARAVALRAAGCPIDALAEQQGVLALRREHLGPQHFHVLASVREVASLLLDLERPNDACAVLEQGDRKSV
ncbi:MAG: serine/threonine protein kinase, partial [Planctomycetota bacterium]